jgi:hypothetical protein
MPYVTKCPACKRQHYFSQPPKGDGVVPVICAGDQCGKEFFWVRLQSIARARQDDFHGPFAVGWEVKSGPEEVAKRLHTLDGVTFIDAYDQGERIDTFSKEDKQVKEGVCAGQCLHWARRVLLGGRATYWTPEKKDSDRKKHLRGVVAQKQREGSKGFRVSTWANDAAAMDEAAVELVGKAKRPFGQIVLNTSRTEEIFAGGIDSFMTQLLDRTDFVPGCCVVICVGLAKGVGASGGELGGHAVALHYADDQRLSIFDPNIGMFACSTKKSAHTALNELIGSCWVDVLEWAPDNRFGFSLFRAAGSKTPVDPRKVVDYSAPSPSANALLNKQLLPAPTEKDEAASVSAGLSALRNRRRK